MDSGQDVRRHPGRGDRGSRGVGDAGKFAFSVGHMPSNLPAGSSVRLALPLPLVLIFKFLLLAKSSQVEFSGLTLHAIKMHTIFKNCQTESSY